MRVFLEGLLSLDNLYYVCAGGASRSSMHTLRDFRKGMCSFGQLLCENHERAHEFRCIVLMDLQYHFFFINIIIQAPRLLRLQRCRHRQGGLRCPPLR